MRGRLALLLALAAACAAPKPGPQRPISAAPAPADAPEAVDVAAALAQEIEPLPLARVEAADGSFRAEIEASSPPQVSAGEDFTVVQTRLGEALVVCFVYPRERELGSLMRQLVDVANQSGAKAAWVEVRADQVEGWGYVLARARYVRPPPDDDVSGDLKLAAASSTQAAIACAHDWPGQYASFERALRGFIASLELEKKADAAPIEATIMRSVMSGRWVNLSRTYSVRQGKDVVSHDHSTTLWLGAGGELSVSDYVAAKTFAKGTLKNGDYMREEGGVVKYWLSLTRGGGRYRVSGVVDGQAVAAEFPAVAGFADADGRAVSMCKVRAGQPPRLTLVDFDPDVDPLRASSNSLEKSDTPEGEVRVRVQGAPEGAEGLFRLDAECRRAGGTIKMGSASLQIERIFHEKSR